MREFPSPLSGFSTPFGKHGALSAYAVGSFEPELVLDFEQEYYRTGGTRTTFDSATVFERISDATYVDNTGTIQIAASGVARVGHHFWNGSEWEKGALFEPSAAVQLLHTTDTLVTQSHTVTAEPHTLQFTGTGTVTLSGAYSGSLVGTGTGEENRVSLTFTPTAASLTLTVSGIVSDAQLEVGSVPTSYIPNLAGSGTVTRAAETLTVPSANLPWPTPNVIGPELVTNGTFDTDISGWSAGGSDAGAESVVSGAVRLAGNEYIYQTITGLTAGQSYILTANIVGTNSQSSIRIGTAANVGDLYDSPTQTAATTLTTTFTPSGTAVVVTLKAEATVGSTSLYVDFDNISVKEIDPLAVPFHLEGRATGDTLTTARWYLDANNYITQEINTSDFTFEQANAGTVDAVTGGSFTSGVNTSFNIASRHGSTFINGAVDGTALTANTTPTALPDLSSTDLSLAYSGGPMILKKVRIWANDLGDTGIAEASA